MRYALTGWEKVESDAAILIQSAFRKRLAKRVAQEKKKAVVGAATKIQAQARRVLVAKRMDASIPTEGSHRGKKSIVKSLTNWTEEEEEEEVDAEVAEEKRSVFRALTRLRGAAITSFD